MKISFNKTSNDLYTVENEFSTSPNEGLTAFENRIQQDSNQIRLNIRSIQLESLVPCEVTLSGENDVGDGCV